MAYQKKNESAPRPQTATSIPPPPPGPKDGPAEGGIVISEEEALNNAAAEDLRIRRNRANICWRVIWSGSGVKPADLNWQQDRDYLLATYKGVTLRFIAPTNNNKENYAYIVDHRSGHQIVNLVTLAHLVEQNANYVRPRNPSNNPPYPDPPLEADKDWADIVVGGGKRKKPWWKGPWK